MVENVEKPVQSVAVDYRNVWKINKQTNKNKKDKKKQGKKMMTTYKLQLTCCYFYER